MPNIGTLGGLNYEMDFPTTTTSPLPTAIQPVKVDVPELPDDPIAVRQGLTADYYNNYGMLKAFAQDMARKGIDPFQPDLSQEGGGLAFQTMQMMQANLLHSANALRGEFEAEKQMRPLQATGQTMLAPGVDTQSLYASDANNFIPTKQLPGTEELNQRLAQETNDPSSAARVNAMIEPYKQRLDAMVAQGLISPARAEAEKQSIIANAWRTQPYAPRTSGIQQSDLAGRADLIKKVKQGILTSDPTALNIFKLSPSVADANYVNTGDKIGIELWLKGQYTPTFIDLSQGGGEQEINAYLNRIEGQKNIPNESVGSLDTKVSIPSSNVREIIDDPKGGVKSLIRKLDPQAVDKLNQLAAEGKLSTPNGEPVQSVEVHSPFIGYDKLKVTYHPVENDKVNYNKTKTLLIYEPDERDNFIETNANSIGPAFGGGFVTKQSTGFGSTQSADSTNVINPGGKKIF